MNRQQHEIGAFKVFLRTSKYHLTEVDRELFHFENVLSSSSSWYSSVFVRSSIPTVYLLSRGNDQFRYLLLEPASGWVKATLDDRGHVWVCDKYGKHVAVVHPDEQEGHGFVLPGYYPDGVQAIAAYDNTVALATFEELVVYHYDDAGGYLKEMLRLRRQRSEDKIIGIKPDVEERGLWVIIYVPRSSRYVLTHLPLNGEVYAPRDVEQTSHSFEVRTLGDWPEKVYFAYIDDNERVLHYTLNPKNGWCKVSLQNVVRGGRVKPVSMSSDGDAVFVLVRDGDAKLLIRLQADNAELISAFGKNSVGFMRWGDWLVLYSEKPLAFDHAYADRAAITELPENKGILFFHLPTNRFYAKPYQPYAITDVLRSMLSSRARGFLKPLL